MMLKLFVLIVFAATAAIAQFSATTNDCRDATKVCLGKLPIGPPTGVAAAAVENSTTPVAFENLSEYWLKATINCGDIPLTNMEPPSNAVIFAEFKSTKGIRSWQCLGDDGGKLVGASSGIMSIPPGRWKGTHEHDGRIATWRLESLQGQTFSFITDTYKTSNIVLVNQSNSLPWGRWLIDEVLDYNFQVPPIAFVTRCDTKGGLPPKLDECNSTGLIENIPYESKYKIWYCPANATAATTTTLISSNGGRRAVGIKLIALIVSIITAFVLSA